MKFHERFTRVSTEFQGGAFQRSFNLFEVASDSFGRTYGNFRGFQGVPEFAVSGSSRDVSGGLRESLEADTKILRIVGREGESFRGVLSRFRGGHAF